MKTLEDASIVETVYGNDPHSTELLSDANRLREALVQAVRTTHPGHREDIEGVIPSCVEFLAPFGNVFTLNYDLLLYWVILQGGANFSDGFGLGIEANGFLGPFKTEAYCTIFNVHGGLHLFRKPDDDVEKCLIDGSHRRDCEGHYRRKAPSGLRRRRHIVCKVGPYQFNSLFEALL